MRESCKFHIPPNYVVTRYSCSSKATRGEDLQVEHPVLSRYAPTFHFHPTLTCMQSSALIRDEVVQVGKPCEKRLLAPIWMVKPLHGEQLPFDGVMGLIQQGARHRQLRVCEDRIPACLLVLKPASYPRTIGGPSRGSDVVHKVAEPLPQRKYPQAPALTLPVP